MGTHSEQQPSEPVRSVVVYLSRRIMIIAVSVLLLSLFDHHKHQPQTKPAPHVSTQQLQEDMQYLDKATRGLKDFRDDELYAQYENVEIETFATQLELCKQEMLGQDAEKFDADVNILRRLGGEMEAQDAELHIENVI